MTLLAWNLAANGTRVAHVMSPPGDPRPPEHLETLELVARGPYAGRGPRARVVEAVRIWRALRAADAATYVVRGSSPALGIAGLFCRVHRRHLVFSSANELDFTLERLSDRRHRSALYRLGVGSASALVVQSATQRAMAQETFPDVARPIVIPSIAEVDLAAPTRDASPEAFLWIGRLIGYKRPLEYLRLARELPDIPFRMIGIDNEFDPIADRVRAQAAELDNVELLDPRPHEETMDLICRSAALVSTSRIEGVPNVFLEAWARQVPVLSLEFDPDGVIADKGLGIAAAGEWPEFVAGAVSLWRDESLRGDAGLRGRDHVLQTHSPPAVAAQWQQLLGELDSPQVPAGPRR